MEKKKQEGYLMDAQTRTAQSSGSMPTSKGSSTRFVHLRLGDDGKSTLIERMLFEAQLIFEAGRVAEERFQEDGDPGR